MRNGSKVSKTEACGSRAPSSFPQNYRGFVESYSGHDTCQDDIYHSLIHDCIENRRRVLRDGDTIGVTSITSD